MEDNSVESDRRETPMECDNAELTISNGIDFVRSRLAEKTPMDLGLHDFEAVLNVDSTHTSVSSDMSETRKTKRTRRSSCRPTSTISSIQEPHNHTLSDVTVNADECVCSVTSSSQIDQDIPERNNLVDELSIDGVRSKHHRSRRAKRIKSPPRSVTFDLSEDNSCNKTTAIGSEKLQSMLTKYEVDNVDVCSTFKPEFLGYIKDVENFNASADSLMQEISMTCNPENLSDSGFHSSKDMDFDDSTTTSDKLYPERHHFVIKSKYQARRPERAREEMAPNKMILKLKKPPRSTISSPCQSTTGDNYPDSYERVHSTPVSTTRSLSSTLLNAKATSSTRNSFDTVHDKVIAARKYMHSALVGTVPFLSAHTVNHAPLISRLHCNIDNEQQTGHTGIQERSITTCTKPLTTTNLGHVITTTNSQGLGFESPMFDMSTGTRREHHNAKERIRRYRIKDACDQMRCFVPGLSDKTDKATVLEFTGNYLRFLREKGLTVTMYDMEFIEKYPPTKD